MKRRLLNTAVLVFAAGGACSIAVAQTVVVPNSFAGTAGANGLNTFIRDTANPRTGQLLMDSSELATIPAGSLITGIEFRLWVGAVAPFPVSDATWATYDIYVGPCVQPALGTTTFATNFVGLPTQVRTGPLTMLANTYPSTGGPPRPFGPVITFNTPFIYTGGHLGIEIRHPGSNIVNPAASSHFLDVALATETVNRSFTAIGNTATVGAAATYTVSRLTYTPGGPTGACCVTSGASNCVINSAAGCLAAGGTYAGDGVTCAAANCPPLPSGACCFTFQACQVVTQAACTAAGGTYSGDNVTCAAANCPAISIWLEQGEAGETPATAQIAAGSGPLSGIRGALVGTDSDMYQVDICDEANFSAATTAPGATFDTQLWLFNVSGTGVTFNDDTVGLQSALSSTLVTANGLYLLAVSGYDRDAVDSGGQALWIDTPFAGERAPDGPGAANPIAGWDVTGAAGPYTIALTGTCFVGGASGACCLGAPSYSCTVTSPAGCAGLGGTYAGDGVSCPAANCPPPPTGACCSNTGCTVLTQALCLASGGTYAGNNVTCAAANCPPATHWAEQGEAGTLPGTAQTAAGSGPLQGIIGTTTAGDSDMYLINICDEANFSASTVGTATWDTQLWLFNTSGGGIAFCDDNTGLQSLLSSTFVTANGLHLLAISSYDNDALDSGALEIWLDGPFVSERAPDGPGAANPVASWSGAGGFGSYTIALTGSCFVPSCYANCDGSTVSPVLTANDFQCFANSYAAGSSTANCDGSTGNPLLTANDFQCFANAYAAGCS